MLSALVVIGSVLVAGFRWQSAAARSGLERALVAALPVTVGIALLVVVQRVVQTPWSVWHGIRLAPSAAIAQGMGLPGAGAEAPIIGHLYGPMSAVYFVPAALLPTPTAALLAASTLAFLAVAGPLWWMLRLEAGGDRLAAALPLAVFALNGAGSDVVRQVSFAVHADAPALGLGALACALLYRPEDRTSVKRLGLAAAVALLAVFAKQPMVPLLLAIPGYLLLADGSRRALTWVAFLAASSLVAFGVVSLLPRSGLLGSTTDALAVVSGIGWKGGSLPAGLVRAARDLVPRAAPFLVLLVVYGATAWQECRRTDSLRGWASSHPWLLPALVAIACGPTALAGRALEGASMNGLAYTLYFAATACLLVAARLLCGERDGADGSLAPGARAAFLVVLAAFVLSSAHVVWELPADLRSLPENPQAQAFRFARDHPGEAYFPYHPLAGLKADGRLYHVLLPMTTRVALEGPLAAGDTEGVTRALRRHMPPRVRSILYPSHLHVDMVRRFEALRRDVLPDFDTTVSLPEMPDWTVLRESPGPTE